MDDKTLSDFLPSSKNADGIISFGTPLKNIKIKISIDTIIEQLTQVKDPELDINVYDLGLIYDIQVDNLNNIEILMTLTTVNCPVADSFPLDIAKKIHEIPEAGQINIKLTFEPSWNKDMMSEDARLALGY
ncbi:MAG: iron-sulfur cluster assembly protein [Pelagibacteraceae bacterium]|jgi:metal-sulfur cluster biosynthetic enzyme